jgi:HEAT repeat protein
MNSPESYTVIIQGLESFDLGTRKTAAHVLGNKSRVEAVKPLLKMLSQAQDSTEQDVAFCAFQAIMMSDSEAAKAEFSKAIDELGSEVLNKIANLDPVLRKQIISELSRRH